MPDSKARREGTMDPIELRQVVNATNARLRQCPKCGEASLTRQEGCDTCVSCGYSKCG